MFPSTMGDPVSGTDPHTIEMIFRHDEVLKNLVQWQAIQNSTQRDIYNRLSEIDKRIESSLLKITSGIVASLLIAITMFVMTFALH